MRRYTHVLYHGNCPDGFGAAYAVWNLSPDAPIKYIPVNYGDPVPDLPADAEVLICDFAFSREQLLALWAKVKFLQVIDHHKTAMEALEGLDFAYFNMERSGAALTWNHCAQQLPDAPVPDFIAYLEDRDLWKWQLSMSREVSQALRSYPLDFRVWRELFCDIQRLKTEGVVARRLTEALVKTMCRHFRWQNVGGFVVPVTNATVFYSEVGEELCIQHPEALFSAYYFDRGDGFRQWGLRSRNGFDTSYVAKSFGGGGHPAASGFEEDLRLTK